MARNLRAHMVAVEDKSMKRFVRDTLTLASLALILDVNPASAQEQVRIRGTIEGVEGTSEVRLDRPKAKGK